MDSYRHQQGRREHKKYKPVINKGKNNNITDNQNREKRETQFSLQEFYREKLPKH